MWIWLDLGRLDMLPYIVFGAIALAVLIPLAICIIRFMNQTWFDPDLEENVEEPP